MTLKALLHSRIAAGGPISIADYMAECLMHPEFGYYTSATPFGQAGDFITAPEISQMFGEMLGLALAQVWMDQGAPNHVTLAELGPGRGTLMADLLRATRAVPGFHDALEIVLVEQSPQLRDAQRAALKDYKVGFLPDVTALPDQPLLLVANEFFDALPVRQFQRSIAGWRERQVGLAQDDADRTLVFGLGPETPQPALAPRLDDTRDGDVVEYAPMLAPVVAEISARIEEHGGAGLIIDYGDWRSLGDTLQAVRGHDRTDPLEAPGRADLTTQVDFEAIAEAATCAHTRLTPQGVFLERLGITARAQALAARLQGGALDNHIAAHRRLTHPDEMGNLFKVLGLMPRGQNPPPGLEL